MHSELRLLRRVDSGAAAGGPARGASAASATVGGAVLERTMVFEVGKPGEMCFVFFVFLGGCLVAFLGVLFVCFCFFGGCLCFWECFCLFCLFLGCFLFFWGCVFVFDPSIVGFFFFSLFFFLQKAGSLFLLDLLFFFVFLFYRSSSSPGSSSPNKLPHQKRPSPGAGSMTCGPSHCAGARWKSNGQ